MMVERSLNLLSTWEFLARSMARNYFERSVGEGNEVKFWVDKWNHSRIGS